MCMSKDSIYTVTSLRDYGNGEVYYGADGIFYSKEGAVDYIMSDMKEACEDYEDYLTIDASDPLCTEYVIDKDEHGFAWRIDEFADISHKEEDNRTYIVTEWCANCDSEIEMRWNTDDRGYQAFCPVCGATLMLCDECRHSDDFKDCDWSDGTCHRMKKEDKQNGDD